MQQVLEIERQARAIPEAAMSEAEQLPVRAELEARAVIEKARTDAEEQGRQMIAHAQADEECARILTQAEANARRTEALAMNNFDHAVAYVLDRVVGKE